MTESLLGKDLHTNAAVLLSQAARRYGLYIIGSTGQGKTGLIDQLIVQDIAQGLGVCVLDAHGDLIEQVLAHMSEKRVDDVLLLDLADEAYPFGFNLFACGDPHSAKAVQYVVDQVMHIFERLFEVNRTETPLLMEYLRACTYTLVANPGCTMADIPLLLTNRTCRHRLLANVNDQDTCLFWQQYEAMKPTEQREQAASTLRRVREFLQPLSRTIIGQSTPTIDLRAVMDERKILLVKLDARLESITSLVGSMLIALILNAAYSRTELETKKRKQFNLYADEFQRFATQDFATLLTEARKFGIATTIAHQFRDQLDVQNQGATLNVANIVVFRVTPPDAQELAGLFDTTPPQPSIIGQRPIATHKHDVVNHLLRNGHTNPLVNAFVQKYLTPAHNLLAQKVPAFVLTLDFWDNPKAVLYEHEIAAMLGYLDSLLYQAMANKEVAPRFLEEMVLLFSKVWGFYHLLEPYYDGLYDGSVRGKWAEFTMLCEPAFEQHLDSLLKTLVKRDLHNQTAAFRRCVNSLKALRQILQLLADEPIMGDSGKTEPIYDKPRAYVDVHNEIASLLANLPRYTAKIKIMGADGTSVEHTIKTCEPERGIRGTLLQERKKRIQQHNRREGYVRERAEVEEEIRKRQEQWTTVLQEPSPAVARRKKL